MEWRRWLRFALPLGLTLSLALIHCGDEPEPDPYNASLDFDQLDFTQIGQDQQTKDSPWGTATLGYENATELLYFNLAVNGRWVVQNLPVPASTGRRHLTFAFDLGVSEGTKVSSLSYAHDLTLSLLDSMPTETDTATVSDRSVVYASSFRGRVPILVNPRALELGGTAADSAFHGPDFPNTGAGNMECVPAAVSNSLRYLNDEFNLGLTDEETSLATMKPATDWDPTGCPFTWYRTKDQFMRDNRYPISTRRVNDFDQIIREIKAGQDVELCGDWHCAAVTGIVRLADGRYVLYVTHDTAQGEGGGEITEKIIYDPDTGRFEGSPGFFDGSGFSYFVVECPMA